MLHTRALVLLLATVSFLAAPLAEAQMGIESIPDQVIPSGKTLVVPLLATDPSGPARTYSVTLPASTGSSGFTATIRTGDPHLVLGVSYTDSNGVMQTGTMEFQMLREFAPITTKFISGLTEGGFYSPKVSASGTSYITFHRVINGEVIQGGDPNGDGTGGPGFSFENEFNRAIIFSGTAGQLAMANSGYGIATGTDGKIQATNGTNGSQFFVTLSNNNRPIYDFAYTIFGQLLRGYDTLFGIGGTPVTFNGGGEYSSPISPVDITSATVTTNNTDAVLILSGTGLQSGPITVTATSGTTPVTTTFNATLAADTVDDPPFLQPIPDTTQKNGTAKVALSGTDLQLDFLRYGVTKVLPVLDPTITSGSSPILSIPLVSNTDNTLAGVVDHWNPTERGQDIKVFHIGAGATPIKATLAAIPAGRFSSLTLPNSFAVSKFTASTKDTAQSITASVNWGDGTILSSTSGDVAVSRIGSGKFQIIAPQGHTYSMPGEFPVVVKIADAAGAHALIEGTANISNSAIALTANDVAQTSGTLKDVLLASFDDNGTGTAATDYAATINWGDGVVTSGTIKSAAKGTYDVRSGHVYRVPGDYTVSTIVSRTGTSGYSASAWARAAVTGTFGPQVFPPFRQSHLAQLWSTLQTSTNSVSTTGSNGGNPWAALIQGTDGNFYGTTEAGGASNAGTVYSITSSGSLRTIYSFTGGADGGNPVGPLLEGTNGNFYGTTVDDGTAGYGTVYEVTTTGSLTTLHTFMGTADGAYPYDGLTTGTDGNLYGTTVQGGTNNDGSIFMLTTSGSFTPLYSFSATSGTNAANADGAYPYGSLTTGTDGNLYGTAYSGGANGNGSIFMLTASGSVTAIYSFSAMTGNINADGGHPYDTLITGTDGNLYGTASAGGSGGEGTVFQVTTSGSLTPLYSFSGYSDGGDPYAGLLQGSDGNLYGTTVGGNKGALFGTIFSINEPGPSVSSTLNTLYVFQDKADGHYPRAALVEGTDSYLYGSTQGGGANGFGTVYQIPLGTSGTLNTIYSFGAGNGSQSILDAAVMVVNSGNLPSTAGTLSVYASPDGQLDGSATILSQNGKTQFAIPPLKPGQYSVIQFYLNGSTDNRLKAPEGAIPNGDSILGVIQYYDPVGNYDGSQRVVKLGSF